MGKIESFSSLFLALVSSSALGQSTTRVSVDSAGVQANGYSLEASISQDGRFVAFVSKADNLAPGDTNGHEDVFVHDRKTGITQRVSVSSNGMQADQSSGSPVLSADGRFVAFSSYASNLVPGDSNGVGDVFLHDRRTGSTRRISLDSFGAEGNNHSSLPSLSADGRFVGFFSSASNLVTGDTNGKADAFVRDRVTGVTERVNVSSLGLQANGFSGPPSLSADARFVAFYSSSTNLVAGDTNGQEDVFVRDRQEGTTKRVSVSTSGIQGNGSSINSSISADGRVISFESSAINLVPGDVNASYDIFVHDRISGQTELISANSEGIQGNSYSAGNSSLSADGRYVAFSSGSTNLIDGDVNNEIDLFLRDRATGKTSLLSVGENGSQGNALSAYSSISGDGRYIAFHGEGDNLVAQDTNQTSDIFVRDRIGVWVDLGQGLAGTQGVPSLSATGSLYPDSIATVSVENGPAHGIAVLLIGSTAANLPFQGGILVPSPDVLIELNLDGAGSATFSKMVPAHSTPGTQVFLQAWSMDPVGPQGYSASNALMGTVP